MRSGKIYELLNLPLNVIPGTLILKLRMILVVPQFQLML